MGPKLASRIAREGFYASYTYDENRKQAQLSYWKSDLDVRDEQLAGFGEILQTIASKLDDIVTGIQQSND